MVRRAIGPSILIPEVFYHGVELILCGHSLGAGVAALLGLVSNMDRWVSVQVFNVVPDVGRFNYMSYYRIERTSRGSPRVCVLYSTAVRRVHWRLVDAILPLIVQMSHRCGLESPGVKINCLFRLFRRYCISTVVGFCA